MNKEKIGKQLKLTDAFLLIIFLLIFNISAGVPDNSIIMASRWLICIVLTALSFFYAGIYNDFKIKILPRSFVFLIFPLLIQCLWDLDSIEITLARSLSFFLYCISIYFFMNRDKESPIYIRKIYNLFCLTMGLFVFISNLLFFGNYSTNGDFIGFYPNRNMTVSLLISCLLIFGNFLLGLDFKLKKLFFIGYAGMMTYMIFITHSRMAFICYTIIVIYFLLFIHKRKNTVRNIILIILIPIVMMGLPLLGQVFDIDSINRIFIQTSSDDSTGLGRDVWDIGFTLISERPIEGWGANSTYYHTFVDSTSRWGWGVHNSYLVMLIEGGLIGTICYISFFANIFYRCWSSYHRYMEIMSPNEKIFIKICFLNCIVLLVNGMSESFLFSAGNAMSLPFWFSLLTMYAYLEEKKYEEVENK